MTQPNRDDLYRTIDGLIEAARRSSKSDEVAAQALLVAAAVVLSDSPRKCNLFAADFLEAHVADLAGDLRAAHRTGLPK